MLNAIFNKPFPYIKITFRTGFPQKLLPRGLSRLFRYNIMNFLFHLPTPALLLYRCFITLNLPKLLSVIRMLYNYINFTIRVKRVSNIHGGDVRRSLASGRIADFG